MYGSFNGGLTAHVAKDDRFKYYSRYEQWNNDEFNKGVMHLFCRFKDCHRAHAIPFNVGEIHAQLLRSKLPIPIYSSDHIIWGRKGDEITGMKIIRFFDHYRPLLVPEVWWFEFLSTEKNDDDDDNEMNESLSIEDDGDDADMNDSID